MPRALSSSALVLATCSLSIACDLLLGRSQCLTSRRFLNDPRPIGDSHDRDEVAAQLLHRSITIVWYARLAVGCRILMDSLLQCSNALTDTCGIGSGLDLAP